MLYLTAGDVIAVTIALTASLSLVIMVLVRNAQLTLQRDNYRRAYIIQRDARNAYDNRTAGAGE